MGYAGGVAHSGGEGNGPEPFSGRSVALISDIQTLLVILMVFAATALARGIRP